MPGTSEDPSFEGSIKELLIPACATQSSDAQQAQCKTQYLSVQETPTLKFLRQCR